MYFLIHVGPRVEEESEWKNGECLISLTFQVGKTEKALVMNGGEGCTTM
jgi:hypothetical protein